MSPDPDILPNARCEWIDSKAPFDAQDPDAGRCTRRATEKWQSPQFKRPFDVCEQHGKAFAANLLADELRDEVIAVVLRWVGGRASSDEVHRLGVDLAHARRIAASLDHP